MCDDSNISRLCQATISGRVDGHAHRLGHTSSRHLDWHVCHDLMFAELASTLPSQTNWDAACQGVFGFVF